MKQMHTTSSMQSKITPTSEPKKLKISEMHPKNQPRENKEVSCGVSEAGKNGIEIQFGREAGVRSGAVRNRARMEILKWSWSATVRSMPWKRCLPEEIFLHKSLGQLEIIYLSSIENKKQLALLLWFRWSDCFFSEFRNVERPFARRKNIWYVLSCGQFLTAAVYQWWIKGISQKCDLCHWECVCLYCS